MGWPTVEEIIAKHQNGETLTGWERSVYRLNVRDNGERYSSDATERAAQMDADFKARGNRTRRTN